MRVLAHSLVFSSAIEPSVYVTGDTVLTREVTEAVSRLRPDVVVAPAGAAIFGIGDSRYYSARTWWMKLTEMDPSPTAEATRFVEPERTSPAAKTPGTLVSSR